MECVPYWLLSIKRPNTVGHPYHAQFFPYSKKFFRDDSYKTTSIFHFCVTPVKGQERFHNFNALARIPRGRNHRFFNDFYRKNIKILTYKLLYISIDWTFYTRFTFFFVTVYDWHCQSLWIFSSIFLFPRNQLEVALSLYIILLRGLHVKGEKKIIINK